MKFFTEIKINRSSWQITYADKIFLLGSCFSDNLAQKMREYYLNLDSNPWGTLYNPISIAHHMGCEIVAKSDVIIITFGTAWVYILKDGKGANWQDNVVDNCHKDPAWLFERHRLTVEEIVDIWLPIVQKYADKRFVFTVSPIRHFRDGFHENQLSKSILLLACEEIINKANNKLKINYFPSYEILLDELRDYRFYADDLIHPSSFAIQRLWEHFADTYLFDNETRQQMEELHQLYKDVHHRLLHPESDEAKVFVEQTRLHFSNLQRRYPWLGSLPLWE